MHACAQVRALTRGHDPSQEVQGAGEDPASPRLAWAIQAPGAPAACHGMDVARTGPRDHYR
eukprot:13246192-Alexandrium_andersonii.AAC.1